jgi:hypothetical protein
MKRVTYLICLFLVFNSSIFANGNDVDFLRSTGKIYSVIAVVVVIFIGLAIFLWRIDNKLSKLENHIKDE